MFCPHCGNRLDEKSRYCYRCGKKRRRSKILYVFLFIAVFLSGTYFSFSFLLFNEEDPQKPAFNHAQYKLEPQRKQHIISLPTAQILVNERESRELTEIIADGLETVYTVYTSNNQGSGFLYNNDGVVATNAHVVEGSIDIYIRTRDGNEFRGKVIGYSNETDVALVHVPDLAGLNPFPTNKESGAKVGEEVIALGSPLGLENTATVGYITGQDRNFVINTYVYESLYQISAPISPGSSGGPLISRRSEKIIAINSAQNLDDTSIGFSIPLYKVDDLLHSWIHSPMKEEEIVALFNKSSEEESNSDYWNNAEDEIYYDEDNFPYEEEDWFIDYLEEWLEEFYGNSHEYDEDIRRLFDTYEQKTD